MRACTKRKAAVIIQARMSSARFPGKMLQLLAGLPLVEYVYRRCSSSSAYPALVATSVDSSDDAIFALCRRKNIPVMRGDLNDVLKRYAQAADITGADIVVRVCGDTPFVDTAMIGRLVSILRRAGLDYTAPDKRSCATAFYSEAVAADALREAVRMARKKKDREHVTGYIIANEKKFAAKFVNARLNPEYMKDVRLTIDYPEDLDTANRVIAGMPDKMRFTSPDVLKSVRKVIIHKRRG